MKKVSQILKVIEASLNGSLDGLELDNTADVVEKSDVVGMVKDLMKLVNEAQELVNNISSKPDVIKSVCQCRKDLPNGAVELCDKCYPTDKA